MKSWIPFSLRYFPLGEYISPTTKPSHLLLAQPLTEEEAEETAPLIALSAEQKKALENKISKLDAVMYYDQLAVAFVVSMLKGAKEINYIEKNSTASTIIEWCVYGLPVATIFVNGVLKGVRDDAAKELKAPRAQIQ